MPKFARPTAYNGRQSNKDKTGQARFATDAEAAAGTAENLLISPATMSSAVDDLLPDATQSVKGKVELATAAEMSAGTDTSRVPAVKVAYDYINSVAIAGAPAATETTAGIAELATSAEATTGTDDARIMTPLKVATVLASPPAIGGTAAAAGTFTDLTADGTGTVTLTSNAASVYDVTGAGNDLTLSSDAGRVIVNGEEAAANAITLLSAAGGIDADCALQMNLASSQNAADAIRINASAGGIDIDAVGAAGEDIDILNTGGSISISATESASDAIVLDATTGGIDILASGAAAGEDIDIVATGSSVNISSTENVSDSIVISSTNGGIDILATGAVAGEDIDITASSSINVTSTEDVANAIYLHANGGTSETIKIHSDQGTGVASVEVASDVGGVTVSSGLASDDAINISASAGGVDIDGAMQVNIASSENTADSIVITSSAGGIDILANGAAAGEDIDIQASSSINLLSTENAAEAIYLRANGGISETIHIHSDQGTGVASINIDSDVGGVTIQSGLASADAINLSASAGGVDVDGALQVNIASSQNAADAVRINASAGGIDIDAAGAAGEDIDIANAAGSINLTAGEDDAGAIYIRANAGTSERIRLHADQGTGVDSVMLESDVGGITLSSGLASADAINLSASAGGVDVDGALQVNIASSQAATGAVTLAVSDAAGSITHTGRCVFTPDSITSDNAGVAASVSTLLTLITTDGDSNEDNVTLADGQAGQVKMFAVVAAGNAADSVKITPANMAGGSKITFAADPTGLGCTMCFDGTNWVVVANNGGTIA